jgi:biopolymer transport protein ExbB
MPASRIRSGPTLLEFVKAGGIFMAPIIPGSIVALAISIERWWTSTGARPPRQWPRWTGCAATTTTERLRGGLAAGRIPAAGSPAQAAGHEGGIEDTASHVVHDLERYYTLGTIVCLLLAARHRGRHDRDVHQCSSGAGDATLLAGGTPPRSSPLRAA